jgi:hypothetical protein
MIVDIPEKAAPAAGGGGGGGGMGGMGTNTLDLIFFH